MSWSLTFTDGNTHPVDITGDLEVMRGKRYNTTTVNYPNMRYSTNDTGIIYSAYGLGLSQSSDSIFCNCTWLRTAPSLSAIILNKYCYFMMFEGCTSLTTAPALPATTLANNCYSYMFKGCTSLTTPPALPVTTLATFCYFMMFKDCTSLTTAPALPATTLVEGCYKYMFDGCTSLLVDNSSGTGHTHAWRIPASSTFARTRKQIEMFYNCAGSRSSSEMPGQAGQSYTYYTQNEPV